MKRTMNLAFRSWMLTSSPGIRTRRYASPPPSSRKRCGRSWHREPASSLRSTSAPSGPRNSTSSTSSPLRSQRLRTCSLAELTILDVGHGNCAVLRDDRGAVIVDTGVGVTLLEFLEQCGITAIDAVLISHSDSDHVAGLIKLLSQPHIEV